MARLSSWRRTLLIARRDKLIAQIVALDLIVDKGIDRAHLSGIEFDSGEGRQKTTYRNLNEVLRAREDLETELNRVLNRLCCRGVVNMGLKRYGRLSYRQYG